MAYVYTVCVTIFSTGCNPNWLHALAISTKMLNHPGTTLSGANYIMNAHRYAAIRPARLLWL